ncbi:MAG TPA: haloacid dehalogenase type II [Actinomycetota bacterium]|nr:haloacid dehalogenase type II [Actinomycetota bacterium]
MARSGNRVELRGRALLAGEAAGPALVLEAPLSLWGGLDPHSGRLCDHHHPQLGATIAGHILVMPSGRGSSSSSSVLAEAIRLGTAPAAILLAEPDEILLLGALVADHLYDRACPIVVLPGSAHAIIATGDQLAVHGDRVALTRPGDLDTEESEQPMTERLTAATDGRQPALDLGGFSALTFDCYGTLIDWEAGILAALRPWAAAHRVEVDDEALLAAFGRAESRREADDPTAPYPRILAGVLEDLAADLGVTASREEAAAFGGSVKDWPAFPDSADALAYLGRHYRLVIVSNVDRASFRHSNAKLGVTFDAVITAEDAGAYKPAPNHFRVALARLAELGVAQDRVLHVAQSLFHDHVPAKELGLRTMWVNRRANRPEAGGATPLPPVPVTPDGEVPTMAALADLHRRQQPR